MKQHLEQRPLLGLLGIGLAWTLLHLLSWQSANWSFGDDFAYGGPVQRMLQTAEMHYTDWSSMTLVLQVWMGAAVSMLFGFSYDHLRILSMLLQLSAVCALYLSALRLGIRAIYALFAAVLLLFHPLFVELSLCFDTDVPFLGLFLWSVFFFLRYLQSQRSVDFIFAQLFCVASFYIRDLAVILPPAFALAILVRRGITTRTLISAFSSIALIALAYFAWRWWLVHYHGLPANIDFSRQRMIETWTNPLALASAYARNIVYASSYLGLALLPLSAAFALGVWRQSAMLSRVVAIFFFLITSTAVLVSPAAFEHSVEQILNPFVPYADLPTVHTLASAAVPMPASWQLVCMLLIGCISTAIVVLAFLPSLSRQEVPADITERSTHLFLLSASIVYVVLIFSQWILNRYYVAVLPLLLLLIVHQLKRRHIHILPSQRWLVVALSVVFVYLGLANGHDFMLHQNAAVRMYHYAEDELKLKPTQVDGGFSYNSLRLYDHNYVAPKHKNWWWVHDDEYVISEAPLVGMQEIYRIQYHRWLPPGYTAAIILQRNSREKPSSVVPR